MSNPAASPSEDEAKSPASASPRRLNVENPYSSEIKVEVVIVNYRRPGNLPAIIKGFRAQSEPCRITICEVAKGPERLTQAVRDTVDAVIDLTDNIGGLNRYVAANAFRLPYTWFHDDDMVPGRRMIEGFLRYTGLSYGVLGQMGRAVRKAGFAKIQYPEKPTLADFLVRGYWVQTRDLASIQRFLWKAWDLGFNGGVREDDILLAKSIEAFTGRRAIVVPPLPDGRMNQLDLPEPHAQAGEKNHKIARRHFCTLINAIIQEMHREPQRIVLGSCPPPQERNLTAHLRTAGLVAWLGQSFPSAEILTLDKGEEDCLVELGLSARDMVVVLGEDSALLSACEKEIPRMVIPRATLPREEGQASIPDVALFLEQNFSPPSYDRDGVAVAIDGSTPKDLEELLHGISELGLSLQALTAKIEWSSDVKSGLRPWILRKKVAEFAALQAVVTDSLDYVAFAVLARTPCVMITDHPDSATSPSWWLSGVSAVRVASDLASAVSELEVAIKGSYRGLPELRQLVTQSLAPLVT